jgi:hypothetical protein
MSKNIIYDPEISIENFEPFISKGVYMGSPRSLQACKRVGIKIRDLYQFTYQDVKDSELSNCK